MAETMLVAFGRFLRLLRERRGLSLDHVEALTAAYPEPVSKVYLSRVENGHSKIAFSRMIALCRAYEYPIDAASERLWLDLGVDRMEDAPDTAGKGARELLREGRGYLQRGFRWHAYACARDAIAVAKTTPVSEVFRDHEEQFAICLMNTATGAAKLGRYAYSLVEYQGLEGHPALQPKHATLALERIALAFSGLGQLDRAREYADLAIAAAATPDTDDYLGDCLTARALIADALGDHKHAIDLHHSAFRAYRKRGNDTAGANVLVNLAQTSFSLGRIGVARRLLLAASRRADQMDLGGVRVRVLILTGEIHEAKGEEELAEQRWRDAQRLASRLGDSVLLFKVKYFLYRQAQRTGQIRLTRRLQRALLGMSPWIPVDTAELKALRSELALSFDRLASIRFPGRNKIDPREGTQRAPSR